MGINIKGPKDIAELQKMTAIPEGNSVKIENNIFSIDGKWLLKRGQNNKLESISWNTYNDKITIDNKGTYILYVKVIDNADYITYVNSEYIIFDGYSINSLNAGRNNNFTTNYITNK